MSLFSPPEGSAYYLSFGFSIIVVVAQMVESIDGRCPYKPAKSKSLRLLLARYHAQMTKPLEGLGNLDTGGGWEFMCLMEESGLDAEAALALCRRLETGPPTEEDISLLGQMHGRALSLFNRGDSCHRARTSLKPNVARSWRNNDA